jgi:lipopolysaccharide transport system ATP-binding protein
MYQASISDIPTTSTSDQEVLVKVEGVSKKFCRSLKKSLWYGVCDIGAELNPFRRRVAEVTGDELLVTSHNQAAEGGNMLPATSHQLPATSSALRPGEFWAVDDVSFELRRGECLGLIGHNGAGKTTLLKMLNGLIKPDSGKITMRGRVGALIALGAGFNPILTGRENIYINGSVLGLSKKEIDEKIEEIIDFAEIGEFIDSPVQNYSSGMTVRLGFAVATAMDPDLLLLDEVLAVGDAEFRTKCANRIDRIRENCAVIFVSHAMEHIQRICGRVVLMDAGRAKVFDRVVEGILAYNAMNEYVAARNSRMALFYPLTAANLEAQSTKIKYGEKLKMKLRCVATEHVSCTWRIVIRNPGGMVVCESDSRNFEESLDLATGENSCVLSTGKVILCSGRYVVSLVLLGPQGQTILAANEHLHFEVGGNVVGVTACQLPSSCELEGLEP